MARIYKDRVGETTATTGTDPFALGGALPGYQAFAGVAAVGDTFDYAAFAVDANGVPTGAWETGSGTFLAGDTMARTCQESSNGNQLVNFAAGTKIVLLTENAVSIAALAAGGGGGGGGGGGAFLGMTALHLNADFNIAGGGWHAPDTAHWTVDNDPLGAYTANTTFTAPAGAHFARAKLHTSWAAGAGGDARYIHFYNVTSGVTMAGDIRGAVNETFSTLGGPIVPCAPGDTIACEYNCGSANGDALTAGAFGSPCRIEIEWFSAYPTASSGGGGGVKILGMREKGGAQFGGETSNAGAPIPGWSFTFNLAADTICRIDAFIRYQGGHRIRMRLRLDGTSWLPNDAGNPDGSWDWFSGNADENGRYKGTITGADLIPAGQHTVDVYYNVMDSQDQVTPIDKYITVTPIVAA